MFAYNVLCQFDGSNAAKISEQWLEWLKNEHIADVLAAGAKSAQIVKWDSDRITIEVRYVFVDRDSFNLYEKLQAPRLRAEGLRKFPPDQLGMSFQRSTGEIEFSR